MNWWITGSVIVGAIVIALLFEESREWLGDTVNYIMSFEWFSDIWEFFTGMFDDIGELSYGGLAFGGFAVGLIFMLRKYMLTPFLQHMSPASAIFWMIATYVATGAVGYFIGKKLFED